MAGKRAGNVNATVTANANQFKTEMASAKASVAKFQKSTIALQRKLKRLGKSMSKLGKNMSVSLTAPIAALGAVAVKSFEDQIAAEKRLEDAVGGAATALKKQAAELQKVTRFGDEATMAVQSQLATLGLTEKQILDLTPLIQDLSARTGKDLQKSAKEVTSALSTGATTLEKYGVELSTTNTLAENAEIAIDGLTQSVKGQAQVMAGEGVGPLIQMQNAIGDLAEQFGEIIAEAIKPFALKIKELAERFQKLTPETKKTIAVIAGLAAALGPLLVSLGFITSTIIPKLITGFAALTGPVGLITAGIVALGAAALMAHNHINRIQTAQEVLNDTLNDAQQSISGEVSEINKLVTIAKSDVISREKRNAAVEELQKKYPDYLGNLDKEAIKTGKADVAIKNLKTSILKMAQARAIENKIQELQAKKLEAVTSAGESELTMWDNLLIAVRKFGPGGSSALATAEQVTRGLERGAEATEAYDDQINELISSLADLEQQGFSVTGEEDGDGGGGDSPEKQLDKQRIAFNKFAQDALKGVEAVKEEGVKPLGDDLEMARQRARELSFAFDETPAQILERQRAVLKSFIDDATSGDKPITEFVQSQIDEYNRLGIAIDGINKKQEELIQKQERIKEVGNIVASEVGGAFMQMSEQFIAGQQLAETGFEGFVKKMLQLGAQLISMLIQQAIKNIAIRQAEAVANSIAGATASGAATGPAAVFTTPAFIGAAVAGVLGAFAAIPGFAKGGLVTGETLGLIGEGRGTSRSNPEVVAPLDKLQSMLQPAGGMESLEFVLRGETLRAVTNKTNENRSFTTRQ